MIWWCVRVLMETSPSQSSGQGGGVWWSVQTGHPTAVTDGFHQGAHGLTGEMYMEAAAKGADIYLPAAPPASQGAGREKPKCRRNTVRNMYSYNTPHSSLDGDNLRLKWCQSAEAQLILNRRLALDVQALWFSDLFPHCRPASAWAAINIPWGIGACSWPAARFPVICLNNFAGYFRKRELAGHASWRCYGNSPVYLKHYIAGYPKPWSANTLQEKLDILCLLPVHDIVLALWPWTKLVAVMTRTPKHPLATAKDTKQVFCDIYHFIY